jgi:hypothetical protein
LQVVLFLCFYCFYVVVGGGGGIGGVLTSSTLFSFKTVGLKSRRNRLL